VHMATVAKAMLMIRTAAKHATMLMVAVPRIARALSEGANAQKIITVSEERGALLESAETALAVMIGKIGEQFRVLLIAVLRREAMGAPKATAVVMPMMTAKKI